MKRNAFLKKQAVLWEKCGMIVIGLDAKMNG